jgi:hypothetical protein
MAKPRKRYKKRPVWQWIIFYLLIAGVILSLLYYSGIFGLSSQNTIQKSPQEVEYFE